MADAPALDILDALAQALRQILISNQYNTDIGANVRTERTETGIPAVARCTVAVTGKQRGASGTQRPAGARQVRGVIELEVPASYTNAMAEVLKAEQDVDHLLTNVYSQMPSALPVQWEEAIFLDRPEGMPVVAAEIHWSTGYRR